MSDPDLLPVTGVGAPPRGLVGQVAGVPEVDGVLQEFLDDEDPVPVPRGHREVAGAAGRHPAGQARLLCRRPGRGPGEDVREQQPGISGIQSSSPGSAWSRSSPSSADHPTTLTSRNNLAVVLNHLGRHQEAADLNATRLAARESALGSDHPDTLTSRSNLAAALHELGRHQEAADLHAATLAARESALDPDHPDTLTSRNNLAAAQQRLQAGTRRGRRWRVRRVHP
ncbi:tetratricopeptide repeat protein [Streptomyces sp. NPDC006544]|uniref:tetratricopeptide repeat protein n=1 Tax=Streptomyces sp. NPDC006544 TaxID=3154583 RepID=UPI0033AAE8F2